MTAPVVYRRRTTLIEAVQITAANAADLAEEIHGRVEWIRDRPLLHVPCSVQPARLGDWIARDLTRDRPWYPIKRDVFEDGYEPAHCPTCHTHP